MTLFEYMAKTDAHLEISTLGDDYLCKLITLNPSDLAEVTAVINRRSMWATAKDIKTAADNLVAVFDLAISEIKK